MKADELQVGMMIRLQDTADTAASTQYGIGLGLVATVVGINGGAKRPAFADDRIWNTYTFLTEGRVFKWNLYTDAVLGYEEIT